MTKSKISKLMEEYLEIQRFKYPSLTCSIVYSPSTKTYLEVSKGVDEDKWDEIYDQFQSLDDVEEYLKETIAYYREVDDAEIDVSQNMQSLSLKKLNEFAKDNWW